MLKILLMKALFCVRRIKRAQHEVFLVSMPVLQGQDVYDPGRYKAGQFPRILQEM